MVWLLQRAVLNKDGPARIRCILYESRLTTHEHHLHAMYLRVKFLQAKFHLVDMLRPAALTGTRLKKKLVPGITENGSVKWRKHKYSKARILAVVGILPALYCGTSISSTVLREPRGLRS